MITTITTSFFEYFSERHAVATRSDIPFFDRMVLLTASLDALANHWHLTADRTTTPTDLSGAERMRRFLNRHGQHAAFAKVSAPLLRDVGNQQFVSSFPFDRYEVDRFNPVSDWHDDPDFDDLSRAGINQIVRWSYGGIIYKDLRNAWVHQFFDTNDQVRTPESDILQRKEPYYRFVTNRGKFLLIFPLPFLANALQSAIRSFHQECTDRDVLPFRT